jgi:transcriptional regulator with XRE-family HTH domain
VAGKLNFIPPISGAQIRAARALLKWSVRKLSDQCGVSESAISRGEQVNGTPPMQVRNLNMIRQVFEEHGIEFLGLDGVRLLAQSPELLPKAAISGEVADEG